MVRLVAPLSAKKYVVQPSALSNIAMIAQLQPLTEEAYFLAFQSPAEKPASYLKRMVPLRFRRCRQTGDGCHTHSHHAG